MQFKNNFERDCWWQWYEIKLHGSDGQAPLTPEAAAVFADEVLAQLQSRSKSE